MYITKNARNVSCCRFDEDAALSPSGPQSQTNELPAAVFLFSSQHMQAYLALILAYTQYFYITVRN